MNNLTVKIIKDSMLSRERYITVETYYPRIIHSEVLRHRAISHSVASSRAIPTKKYIQTYTNFVPNNLRKNEKGMSPKNKIDDQNINQTIYDDYFIILKNCSETAQKWSDLGLAKEQVNRILEPFSYIRDLMTFSYVDIQSVFELRCHDDAQEEIRELFLAIKQEIEKSKPEIRAVHFPYIDDLAFLDQNMQDLIKISVARCARTSYDSNATGKHSSIDEDIDLYNRLIDGKHLSPSEHVLFSRKFFERQIMNHIDSIQVFEIKDNSSSLFKINQIEKRRYQYPFSGNMGGDIVQYRKILERT